MLFIPLIYPISWLSDFLSICLVIVPLAMAFENRQGNYTSLSDAFWQLDNLQVYPPSNFLNVGGQNFTHCCLLAVNASLLFHNGSIVKSQTDFINTDVNSFINASKNGQFPCAAKYNGDTEGAPMVSVPYTWLTEECPGWQLSQSQYPQQWIQPLASFLLPAIIFCLTIPRRYKIKVPDVLFEADILKGVSWLLAPFAMALALVFVTIDTLLWLAVCFAFAGPMLLSAVYEAFLDYRVLKLLEDSIRFSAMTTKMRARLLYVILVGNLDLEVGDDSEVAHNGPAEPALLNNFVPNSPWHHIENLVEGLEPYDANPAPNQEEANIDRVITQTKIRLGTMLACQYSFGSTVGAPVTFFLGGFIFTLVGTQSQLGDNSTSLSLAFGMWYMIIPHLSIVSGLLLAGNNPNTLAGIVADRVEEHVEPINYRPFEPAYQSCFKVAWLWTRGHNKEKWLKKVYDKYQRVPGNSMNELKKAITFSFTTWFSVTFVALFLVVVPFLLAFLTAFYTPEIGVSCRALTFLLHFSAQLSGMFLWFWSLGSHQSVDENAPAQKGRFTWSKANAFLARHGFYHPTAHLLAEGNYKRSADWTYWQHFKAISGAVVGRFKRDPLAWFFSFVWYSMAFLSGAAAVLSAIGGTMMQLMGVYSADVCHITTSYWGIPSREASAPPVVISQNTWLQIKEAAEWWVNCGIAGIAIMAAVAFVGWWYQRRLRSRYRWLLKRITGVQVMETEMTGMLNNSTLEVLRIRSCSPGTPYDDVLGYGSGMWNIWRMP